MLSSTEKKITYEPNYTAHNKSFITYRNEL